MYAVARVLWISGLAACAIALPAGAQSLTYTAKVPAPACQDREALERVWRLFLADDREALRELLMPMLLAGRCIMVSQGETVPGSVESVLGGVLRIRKRGEATEYLAHSELFAWDQQPKR